LRQTRNVKHNKSFAFSRLPQASLFEGLPWQEGRKIEKVGMKKEVEENKRCSSVVVSYYKKKKKKKKLTPFFYLIFF